MLITNESFSSSVQSSHMVNALSRVYRASRDTSLEIKPDGRSFGFEPLFLFKGQRASEGSG